MANIEEATQAGSGFLKKVLSVTDAKIIRIQKTHDGWEQEAEVYEESSFIKSCGLRTRVRDRNTYSVKMDENLEVQSYERKNPLRPQE
jgi:hypothetical protein